MTGSVQAGWFGPSCAECYGTLHLPAATHRTDLGLLIVGPTWHEDQSAYRTLRQLAIAASARGISTLRYDTLGGGDSNGDEDDDQHPTGWRASMDAALDLLRAQAGVARLCIVGTRAGALPAALLASARDDVAAWVGIAPVLRGASFLREARLRTAAPPVDARAGFEHAGHRISARAVAELTALDVTMLDRPPALRVMLVGAGDRPEVTRWRTRLEAQGARLHSIAAPKLERLFDGDATVSPELVERIAGWIASHADDARAAGAPTSADSTTDTGAVASANATVSATVATGLECKAAPPAIASTTLRPCLDLPGACETPWTADVAGTRVFGILTTPTQTDVRRAVVVLNTGAGRRIGPSRLHVRWARQWARDGVAVLRLDLPGLGDSGVQPGEIEGEVYRTHAAPAIAAALADLRARHGAVNCTLMGICSGAYHAWRAALDGLAVDALVLINQTAYRWGPDMQVDSPSTLLRVSAYLDAAQAAAPGPRRWRELRWIALARLYGAIGHLRDALRAVGRPLNGDVGAALERLAARGIAVHVVSAERDRAAPLLRLEAARAVDTLVRSGRLRVETVAAANHLFDVAASRDRLQVILDRALATRRDQVPGLRASANAPTATVPTAASASNIAR